MSLGNVIQDLVIRIRYSHDTAGLAQVRQAVAGLKSSIGQMALLGLGMGMAGTAVRAAAQLESAEAKFETMLGSKAKSEEMMKKMWEYAAMSTFEMSHVTKAMTTMLQSNIGSTESYDYIKRLGDVAGDSAPHFQRLTVAMSQALNLGRLQAQERNQFLNAGWNPLRTIANMNFGGNMKAATEAMAKKKISADMLVAALKKETDIGGMYYQGQIKQAKTLMGTYTTMIDNLKMSGAKAVMAMSPLIKSIMRGIGSLDLGLLEKYARKISEIAIVAKEHWDNLMSKFSSGEGMLKKQFGELLEEVRKVLHSKEFVTFIRVVTEAVFAAAVIIGGLFIAFWKIYIRFLKVFMAVMSVVTYLRERFMFIVGFISSIPSRLAPVVEAIKQFWAAIFKATLDTLELFPQFRFMRDLLSGIWSVIKWLFNDIMGNFQRAWSVISSIATSLFESLMRMGSLIGSILGISLEAVMAKIRPIIDKVSGIMDWVDSKSGVISAAKGVFQAGKSALGDAVSDFNDGMSKASAENATPTMDELLKKVAGGGLDVIKQVVENGKASIDMKASVDIDIKGDPNAKTGLTAADVALLSERSMRSMFTIQLQEVLAGVL